MEIIKPIKVGNNIWTNLISNYSKESVNYEEVVNYFDGTIMDDSKCDGYIYRKLPDDSVTTTPYIKLISSKAKISSDLFGLGLSNDDTILFQKAIDISTKLGMKLIIPSNRTILISSTIDLPANANIYFSNNSLVKSIYEDLTLIFLFNALGDNIKIEGLNLDGDLTYTRGVLFNGCQNINISNGTVKNLRGRGIQFSNSKYCKIENFEFDNIMYSGIDNTSGDGDVGAVRVYLSQNISVENIRIDNCAGKAIATQECDTVSIKNCFIDRTLTVGSAGVYLGYLSTNIDIREVVVERPYAQALKVSRGSRYVTITNCNLKAQEGNARLCILFIQGGRNVVVDNNIFVGNGEKHILWLNHHPDPQGAWCRDITITNNLITQSSASFNAIQVIGTADDNAAYQTHFMSFTNNVIEGGLNGILLQNTRGNIVEGNTFTGQAGVGVRVESTATQLYPPKEGTRIINNYFRNAGTSSIYLVNNYDTIIIGNTFYNNSVNNIRMLNIVKKILIQGNILSGAVSNPIYINPSTDNTDINIQGNTIEGAVLSEAGIWFGGSSGSIFNNYIKGHQTPVNVNTSTSNISVFNNSNYYNYQNNVARYNNPRNAVYYSASGSITGALILRLPKSILATTDVKNIKLRLSIHNRSSNSNALTNTFDLNFAGRILKAAAVDVPTWISNGATVTDLSTNPQNIQVRVGFDSDLRPCLIIRDTTSLWQAPTISLEYIQISGGNMQYTEYMSDYNLSIESDISSITLTSTLNQPLSYNPRVKIAASPDSTPTISTTYTQSEVQGILTELRDLKSKMRSQGILLT